MDLVPSRKNGGIFSTIREEFPDPQVVENYYCAYRLHRNSRLEHGNVVNGHLMNPGPLAPPCKHDALAEKHGTVIRMIIRKYIFSLVTATRT